jgi:1-acyl-sn-glycerol-3-phosphate acyltransferase
MALSALGSILLVFGTQIHWLWLLPIGLGMYVALNALFFLGLWFSTIFLPKKDPIDKPRNFYGIIQFVCDWATTALRVKIRFNGMEKLPNEPFVLVSNHVSNFDPVVVLAKVKGRKIAFISKPSNFKIPVAGPYTHNAGFLAIDRENAMKAMRTIKRAAELVVSEQMIMGIYPEGTRSRTGKLLRFKTGAYVLAKDADAPIVVMSTKGTELVSKRVPFRGVKVELEVLEVFDREDVRASTPDELAQRSRDLIELSVYGKLESECGE